MKVDINKIRTILLRDYTDLCLTLNESIKKNGRIVLEAKDIKAQMDNLRLCLGIIAATSIEGRDDFQPVGKKELPILFLPEENKHSL